MEVETLEVEAHYYNEGCGPRKNANKVKGAGRKFFREGQLSPKNFKA